MKKRSVINLAWSVLLSGLIALGAAGALSALPVNGVVLDGDTHEPVDRAVIRIEGLGQVTLADSAGRFHLRDAPEGDYVLRISRIGYRALSQRISVHEGRNLNLYLHLFPLPIQMSPLVVAVEHPNTELDELFEQTGVIEGRDLQRDMGQTLAAVLKNETSLAIRSMGPAPARPVIRGFSGDRVVITEDGAAVADLSATAPDHAVAVDPFTIERIEVLRGPRLLLRGSSTVGGVVNVIRNELPETLPEALTGSSGLFGESANRGGQAAVTAEAPLAPFALRLEGSGRRAGDLHTPGGRLDNSDLTTTNWSAGLSFPGEWGFAGASLREFRSDYGIPGGFVGSHPKGVDIEMFKRRATGRVRRDFGPGFLESLEAEFSRTYYHHTEYESNGSVGAEFLVHNYQGRMELKHGPLGWFDSGVAGAEFNHRDFEVGGYVFTPNSTSDVGSVFIYESKTLRDWDFQFGARAGRETVSPAAEKPDAAIGWIRRRVFNTFSVSGTALRRVRGPLHAGVNLSRTSRAPGIEELFSSGPHLAAYSYETGNPELKTERGYGAEVFAFWKSPRLFANVTLFRDDFAYFLSTRPTGEINYQQLLPVYHADGRGALVSGVECEIDWKVRGPFSFRNTLGYTRGKFSDSGGPLPMIPPFKSRGELRWSRGDLVAGVSVEAAARQSRVDRFEDPTAGYAIMDLFVQYTLERGKTSHSFSLNVDNVFDREYRNHLSRVKSVMPEAGRNLRIMHRMFF